MMEIHPGRAPFCTKTRKGCVWSRLEEIMIPVFYQGGLIKSVARAEEGREPYASKLRYSSPRHTTSNVCVSEHTKKSPIVWKKHHHLGEAWMCQTLTFCRLLDPLPHHPPVVRGLLLPSHPQHPTLWCPYWGGSHEISQERWGAAPALGWAVRQPESEVL